LVKHLKGIGGSGAIGFGANRVESIADAVAKALEMHAFGTEEEATQDDVLFESEPVAQAVIPKAQVKFKAPAVKLLDLCPACGTASLISSEGCKTCTNCGYSRCS
jgi:ribonucleoside-diphosphate reductase alpha chain